MDERIENTYTRSGRIANPTEQVFYYRGLREWGHIDGYLTDTCLTAQDQYKASLDYFRIKY